MQIFKNLIIQLHFDNLYFSTSDRNAKRPIKRFSAKTENVSRERDYYFPKNARKFGIQKININDVSNFEKRKDALKNVELSNCDQEDVFFHKT